VEELQTWWNNQHFTPETLALFQEIGLALVALLGGHILGAMVGRALGARNFDALLRLPGAPTPGSEGSHGFTPTWAAGMLVRLTVWAVAAWWLAHKHGQVELAGAITLILKRTWALAGVLMAALALGSVLAHRLSDCFYGFTRQGADGGRNALNGMAASQRGAAGAVGAGAYIIAVLIVLLIASDSFDWPLTRGAAQALWQLSQHLLTAAAALFIGCLGARWARDLASSDGATTPEKRAGQYTALGIVATTTVVAIALLLSNAGVLIGLAALGVLGLVLWLVRGYLPDVSAGFQLRSHQVREVCFDGVPWQVVEVGFITSQVCRQGEICRVQNRVVLEARMHGAPAEAAAEAGAQ